MAKNSTQGTASAVRELIEPTVTELGYDIWDVEYVKEGADMHLRITIDSEDGIDIDDCEKVHRAIDPLIDEADPIEESYLLEVSSPGIERRLRTPEHFLACIGETVNLKLFDDGIRPGNKECHGGGRLRERSDRSVESYLPRKYLVRFRRLIQHSD